MATVDESNTISVTDGVTPDHVVPEVRPWNLSGLREREGTTPPDYSNNGLDIYRKGDPELDTTNVTIVTGISDTQRNGLQRVFADTGPVAWWAEPSPQTFDEAGTSDGILGIISGPVQTAGYEMDLGVASSVLKSNPATGFPLVARPVITVAGARYETPLATLRADLTITVDGGTPTVVTRDLFYAYGGSSTIILPNQVIDPGGSLEVEVDLKLIYRQDVAEEFEVAVAGCQALLQITEYTSIGS